MKVLCIKKKNKKLPEETYVQRTEVNKNDEEFFIESLDLAVGPTTEKNGVNVLKVQNDSKLIVGDIIIEVNRDRITTVDSFIELVEKIKETGRNSLLLKIIRDENTLWATIKFK